MSLSLLSCFNALEKRSLKDLLKDIASKIVVTLVAYYIVEGIKLFITSIFDTEKQSELV